MTFAEVTRDAFLGGRLQIRQPARGYRAGVDPVLLAASVPAKAGQSALDLGCGVGTAGLCLASRVAGVRVTGVELQPGYAQLARENARENGLPMKIVTGDVAALPDEVRQIQFDHVLINPPYFPALSGTAATDAGRETALREDLPLSTWLDVASRRLKPRGLLHLILRPDRLQDAMRALPAILGSVVVAPLSPRPGREASLILIRAQKEGRAPGRVLAPIQMHDQPQHGADGEDYSPAVKAVLRDGTTLPLG